jgi:hypothetical protein
MLRKVRVLVSVATTESITAPQGSSRFPRK